MGGGQRCREARYKARSARRAEIPGAAVVCGWRLGVAGDIGVWRLSADWYAVEPRAGQVHPSVRGQIPHLRIARRWRRNLLGRPRVREVDRRVRPVHPGFCRRRALVRATQEWFHQLLGPAGNAGPVSRSVPAPRNLALRGANPAARRGEPAATDASPTFDALNAHASAASAIPHSRGLACNACNRRPRRTGRACRRGGRLPDRGDAACRGVVRRPGDAGRGHQALRAPARRRGGGLQPLQPASRPPPAARSTAAWPSKAAKPACPSTGPAASSAAAPARRGWRKWPRRWGRPRPRRRRPPCLSRGGKSHALPGGEAGRGWRVQRFFAGSRGRRPVLDLGEPDHPGDPGHW